MEYLNIDELQEGSVIDYNGDKILLLESMGNMTTYIDEANDEDEMDKIDIHAKVFIRQRWLIEIQPLDKFSKSFKTHRYISAYYCTYGELLKEQERVYTAWDVLPHNEIDSNTLSDNYENNF